MKKQIGFGLILVALVLSFLAPGFSADTTSPAITLTCSGSVKLAGIDNIQVNKTFLYAVIDGTQTLLATNTTPVNNSAWTYPLPTDSRDYIFGGTVMDNSSNYGVTTVNCSYSGPGFTLKRSGQFIGGFMEALTPTLPTFLFGVMMAIASIGVVTAIVFTVKKVGGGIGK